MLSTAGEITTVSDVVRALSAGDLQHGLSLAGIAGQLATVSGVLDTLQMPVLSTFLGVASGQLRDLAVSSLLRARDTRDLAGLLRRTGQTVAGYGTTEMAEGLVRLPEPPRRRVCQRAPIRGRRPWRKARVTPHSRWCWRASIRSPGAHRRSGSGNR
jgi:hypothetical protein